MPCDYHVVSSEKGHDSLLEPHLYNGIREVLHRDHASLPSKSMDMQPCDCTTHTQPLYLKESEELVTALRKFTPEKLQSFMNKR